MCTVITIYVLHSLHRVGWKGHKAQYINLYRLPTISLCLDVVLAKILCNTNVYCILYCGFPFPHCFIIVCKHDDILNRRVDKGRRIWNTGRNLQQRLVRFSGFCAIYWKDMLATVQSDQPTSTWQDNETAWRVIHSCTLNPHSIPHPFHSFFTRGFT